MIQVRHVPARVHKELTRRAKKRGVTLTRYVEELLERDVATLPLDELIARIESREPARMRESAAEMVRRGREERDAELGARTERTVLPKNRRRGRKAG